jgi:hypothetical protein
VEGALDTPILEFGTETGSILSFAIESLRRRVTGGRGRLLSLDRASMGELEELVARELGRRLDGVFEAHIEMLRSFYAGRFHDRFSELFAYIDRSITDHDYLLVDDMIVI